MAKHPLQRLASPSRTFSTIIHAIGLLSFSASFSYLTNNPTPVSFGFGGSFQYLTIIGLALATVTFVCGLVADVTLNEQFFAVKNGLSVCSAPLEVLVSILYFGISAIDRSLVVPPEVHLPFLADFGFHAMPAIMLATDLILLSPPWTVRAYGAMSISTVIAFLYWGWIEYCFRLNGWYPYPLFTLLNTWQRVLLFSFSALLMTGSTMGLKWVYGQVNGIEELKKDAMNPAKID